MHEVDLLGNKDNCKPDCIYLFDMWGRWMHSDRPFGKLYYENNCISYERKPAMIVLNKKHDEYLKQIGCKSRNMIQKSLRNGYSANVINYNDYIDDIYEVNISKPIRQNKPMKEGYVKKPIMVKRINFCNLHFIKYYGIFINLKLVAYANISFMNNTAIINQLLGHGEHLKFGIMNNIINYIVKDCIENHKNIRYINYLTLSGCSKGLRMFKKSVGFEEIDCRFINNIHL